MAESDEKLTEKLDNKGLSSDYGDEIICNACGFSSEFVPEGMIECSRCFAVYYCSKECRDWEYASGGHDKVCQPVALPSISAKASETPGRSDGLLGDSFNNSDGGSTSHASIDVLHLFEKQRSPLLCKSKFLQSSAAKSTSDALKNRLDPCSQSNLNIPASPYSGAYNQPHPANLKQPASYQPTTGTLGTFLEATSPDRPAKATITSLFQINQSNNEGSDEDDDDDDENVNRSIFMKLYMNQHSESIEDESMGLSVLKDESSADLTAIAEESNVMSGPVVEASWRRRNSTISAAISTGTESALDMNDSEIIGVTTTFLMCGMDATTESLAESLASLNSNQDTHENSAVLNLLSVCTSLQSESLGQLEENELAYSERTDSDSGKDESKEHPEVVESSNSTDASDLRVGVVGTLGRPIPIQRGPSLRGFRDAYNECDTASLHSRSLARSSSSSDNSLSSHGDNVDRASELPERLNRSSASLKDFRDIYNADLDRALLPHHQSCSSLCSSSIGFDDRPLEVSIKTPSDVDKNDSVVDLNSQNESDSGQKRKDLSSQLLSLSLEQVRTKTSQSIIGQKRGQRSPSSRSGDDSALQMARRKNESMKDSLNSALRVYEQLYGEDAAKDVFYQLTSKMEPNPAKQEQPSGEQTFDWKRSRSLMKDSPPSNSSVLRNEKSVPNDGVSTPGTLPRYMKYRTSLSATTLSEGNACSDENKVEIHSDLTNCEYPTETARTSSGPVRGSSYSQYRSKLGADTLISSQVENVKKVVTLQSESVESESEGSITRPSTDDKRVLAAAFSSISRYESYRTYLSNKSVDSQTNPNGIVVAVPLHDDAEESSALCLAPVQQILISSQNKNVSENIMPASSSPIVLTADDFSPTCFEANVDENGNNTAECNAMTLSNGPKQSERKSGYLKYREMLGKVDTDETLEEQSKLVNVLGREKQPIDYTAVDGESTLLVEPAAISDTDEEKLELSYAETTPKQRYLQYRSSLQKLVSEDTFGIKLETIQNPSLSIVYGSEEDKDAVESTNGRTYTNELSSVRGKSERQSPPRYVLYRDSLLQHNAHEQQTLSQDNSKPQNKVASIGCKVDDTIASDSALQKRSLDAPIDQPCSKVGPVSSLIRDMERYELRAHGVSPSMCSMANTEDLLKVWNEVELDRKRLNSQRSAAANEDANLHTLVIIPPDSTRDELDHVEKDRENEDCVDIESGKLLEPSSLGWSEDNMKLLAKKHQMKQRTWCGFLILVLVAIPLSIGLGIGLTGSEPTIERKPVIVQTPSISPTADVTSNKPIYDQHPGMTYTPVKSPTSNVFDRTSMPTPITQAMQPTAAPSAPTQQPTKRPSLLPVVSPILSAPTDSPIATNSTQSPTMFQPEKRVELYSLLVNVSSDNGTAIKSSGSPQSLAFQWLASSPDLLLDFSDARIIQRYALATLYFSTDGPRWSDNIGWLSEANECLWYTRTSQGNCDGENIYLNLDLGSNDLTGVIPNELTLLSRLQSLTLSGGPTRFLGGVIPSALGTMTRLTVLDLQENSLFGGIPSAICDLERLEVLDLSLNRLTRPIPSDLGRLKSLKSLNLAMNDLTGIIPTSVQSLSHLQKISLGNNNFVGQVAVGSSWGVLTEFNLENNRFTSLGTEIGFLLNLRTLTLYDNDLIGNLPTEIGNLTLLQRLDLHKNGLTGSIPAEVGALVLLKDLDLSLNNFTSTIPTEIGFLTSLTKLNLQSNLLVGPIPDELGKLSTTSVIKINDNNITGEVSQDLCNQFGFITPMFYADCLEESDGTTKLACPTGSCCTFCCNEESGCVCGLQGTTFEVFCNM